NDGALRRAVDRLAGNADQARLAGDPDHAAPLGRHHRRRELLRQKKAPAHVGVIVVLPIVRVHRQTGGGAVDAGVIDEDVHAPDLRQRRRRATGDLSQISHVDGDGLRHGAGGVAAQERETLLERRVRQVRKNDAGALLREAHSDALAESGGGAGDERGFSVEAKHGQGFPKRLTRTSAVIAWASMRSTLHWREVTRPTSTEAAGDMCWNVTVFRNFPTHTPPV